MSRRPGDDNSPRLWPRYAHGNNGWPPGRQRLTAGLAIPAGWLFFRYHRTPVPRTGLVVVFVFLGPARPRRPTCVAMRQVLLRAVVLLASWAIGLLIAAWIVPAVLLSVSGFIVAVVVFAFTQAVPSLWILKLPHSYASLLLGGTGLALTIVALIFASVLTRGLTIDGMASWLATTVVVWLVTTIGAIALPELLVRDGAGST